MRPAAALLPLLIALGVTFPLVLDPLGRLVGHPDVDVWNHAWGPWWYARSLAEGHLPFRTELLLAPRGGVLWYIDPLGALLGAPLVPLLGAVGAYNAVVVLQVALAAAGGRALARALGAGPGEAWLGAVATAASPYLLSEIHNGVSEAAGVGVAAFALATGRRALTEGGFRRWALAGALLGLTAVGTWYYGFGVALTLAAWTLLGPDDPRPGRLHAIAGLGLAALVAAALAGPALAVAKASVEHPESIVLRGELRDADRELILSHNAVDPRAYVAPLGFQSVDLAARGEAFRHSSYVGLVALALALAARRPRALLGVVPALVLSLGVWLWWGGAWVETGSGARLALPFRALLAVLPDTAATHAQRVGLPVVLTVAALAAVGLGRLPIRARPVAAALVLLDALASAPWPLARAPALDLAAHRALAARGGTVLDLPGEVGATMATSRYLVYQTASGLPIPYRPDARAGTASLLGLAPFHALVLPSLSRPEHRDQMARSMAETRTLDPGQLHRDGGVRWIVTHRELAPEATGLDRTEALLRAWFGEPEVIGTHAIWDASRPRAARVPWAPG